MGIKLTAKEFQKLIEDQRSKGQITTKKDLHAAKVPSKKDYRYVARQGWAIVGEKRCYFRSEWERKYACYLEFLKKRGEIDEWEHEPETFWFKNIKRGVRSYLPDFKVLKKAKQAHSEQTSAKQALYIEVKGFFDSRSRTKVKRFLKYFPDLELIIIDKDWFRKNKSVAAIVPGWNDSL